jgi:hypothetical protein
MALTYTETWWVEECAKAEALAVRKLLFCEQATRDPELQRLCRELAEAHRRHVDMVARACGV